MNIPMSMLERMRSSVRSTPAAAAVIGLAVLAGSCGAPDLPELPDELPDLFPEARIGDAPAERPEQAIAALTPRLATNPDRASITWIQGEVLALSQLPIPLTDEEESQLDRTVLPLPAAEGTPTTTTLPEITSGTMSIGGTVRSETGEAVPNAIIRLERIVGDLVQGVDIRADAEGEFQAPELLGGRYRIRAWRVPDMAMAEAAVYFLEDGDFIDKTEGGFRIELPVARLSGLRSQFISTPSVVRVGDRPNLWIRVSRSSVNEQGVITSSAQPGARVVLPNDTRWSFAAARTTDSEGNTRSVPAVTNSDGDVLWNPTCREAGESSVTVKVAQPAAPAQPGETSRSSVLVDTVLTPPVCHPAIPTPSFRIGQSFSLPGSNQYPPGLYRATPARSDEVCAVSYEPWGTLNWSGERVSRRGNDEFLLEYPGRNFQAEATAQPGDRPAPPTTSIDEEGNVTTGESTAAPPRTAECRIRRVG